MVKFSFKKVLAFLFLVFFSIGQTCSALEFNFSPAPLKHKSSYRASKVFELNVGVGVPMLNFGNRNMNVHSDTNKLNGFAKPGFYLNCGYGYPLTDNLVLKLQVKLQTFSFDASGYQDKYNALPGVTPIQLNVSTPYISSQYLIGLSYSYKLQENLFLDGCASIGYLITFPPAADVLTLNMASGLAYAGDLNLRYMTGELYGVQLHFSYLGSNPNVGTAPDGSNITMPTGIFAIALGFYGQF